MDTASFLFGLSGLLRFFIAIASYLIVQIGEEDAEEGAQKVEKSIGHILHGWYAQHP